MPEFKTEYTRIGRIKDIAGRTIVATSHEYTDSFGLRFDDGTYFYAKADGDGQDSPVIDPDGYDPDHHEARELGIIDQAEFARVEAEIKARRERDERLEYKRMKARFEGSPNAERLQ